MSCAQWSTKVVSSCRPPTPTPTNGFVPQPRLVSWWNEHSLIFFVKCNAGLCLRLRLFDHDCLTRQSRKHCHQRPLSAEMLSTQEKKDKDQFFQDLYRLDHLDDNDDDDVIETECPTKTPKHSARPPVKKSVQPDPAYKGVTENQLQRKRRSCEQDTKPATTTSDSRKRHSSLDRAPSKEKDEKRTGSRENVTDLSNLKLRKQQLKGRLKLKPVPLDQQMFRGCVFCIWTTQLFWSTC